MVKKVSPEEKANQYLTYGRLKVVLVDPEKHEALIHVNSASGKIGDDPYHVRYNGDWHCDCPAHTLLCVHIRAAQKVVSLPTQKPKLGHHTADTDWLDAFLGQ